MKGEMRNMKRSSQSTVHSLQLLAISPWPLATCATQLRVQKVAKGQKLKTNSLATPEGRLWTNLRATKRWTILVGLMAVLATVGCDSYLEELPDNRVELQTLDQAAQLLTNAYPEAGYNFNEWMGDQVSYTLGTRKDQEDLRIYRWEEVNSEPNESDTPEFYWAAAYNAIAHANEVLTVIEQLINENVQRDDTPEDEAQRQAIRGEALLTRAYAHFMLVNLFAKHYDPQTASSDLGVPYVTTPETEFIQEYRRATVQQVYDRIETDLLEGLKLVDGSFYANSGKYHFTRESALALASRFYLYQYDFERCIQYSNELLEPNPSVYIKDIAALKQQQINPEDYIRLYTSPNDPSNLLLLRQQTTFFYPIGFFPDNNYYRSLLAPILSEQMIYGKTQPTNEERMACWPLSLSFCFNALVSLLT